MPSRTGVYVAAPGAEQYGSIACAVSYAHAGKTDLYAMSCQHVFSPTIAPDGVDLASGILVSPVMSPDPQKFVEEVATTSRYGGRMPTDGIGGFDVQLAKVTKRQWLKSSLAELRLSKSRPFARSEAEFNQLVAGQNLEILVPYNHPDFFETRTASLTALFQSFTSHTLSLPYSFTGGRSVPVHHWLLLELRVLEAPTRPGDSGCPVIARDRKDGSCILVGMLIAGDPSTSLSYAIPAWQLLERVNYPNLPFGASLKLVDP